MDAKQRTDWEVVKCLMDAQSFTNAGLEHYLLYAMRDDGYLDETEIRNCLDEAIRNHERAIEDLEAARRRIEASA